MHGDLSLLTLADEDQDVPEVTPVPAADLGALRQWVLSVACINFDLELGPDVEFLYPPLEISKEEKDNIAFSSFPDTSVFSDGSLVFSWRVREVPLEASAAAAPHIPDMADKSQMLSRRISHRLKRSLSICHAAESTKSPAHLAPTHSSRSTSYLYGYTFFLQRRDATNRRGYFQKSLVILTHLPYVSLFTEMVARLGPSFFAHGPTVLELVARDIVQWPAPRPGAALELPLMGTLVHVLLPHGHEPQHGDGMRTGEHAAAPLLASVPQSSMLDVFYEMVPDLWRLWECLLLAEPLLVVGHDPRSTSEAVWHLVDLIRPVPWAGDFRPFFHIHDYDFRALVGRAAPPGGALLGTTNPFFLQTCAHWPHKLHLGQRLEARHGHTAGRTAPCFVSPRKRRISKDHELLRRLLQWRDAPSEHAQATAAVRRHFADVTERFLAPLHQYMATLIPAHFDLSSPADMPPIQPFHGHSFLQWLKAHPGPLRMRQRSLTPAHLLRQSLYADFLKCPNFSLWLQSRIAAAQEEQWQRRIAALAAGDVVTFGRTRSEIESVDLYLRLREELRRVDEALARPLTPELSERWQAPPSPDKALRRASIVSESSPRGLQHQRQRLTEQMSRLLDTMPADLRIGLSK
ncbi:hypothetical protein MCAP1_001100 [Malassezia caprae]|uniref:UDENN domain-containing protein n=1 Tax=Malassezia caprae TaxID=1381934 RepID=A0AAF0EA64_9BASI|nr:hypothetical protein MCAP1_001100 [Malassezia caprae]